MGHSRLPLSSRKSVFCSPSSPSFYRAPPCMQKSDGDDPRRDATSPPLDGDAICMRARNFSFPFRVGRGNKWGRRCRVFRPSVLVRRRPIKSLSRRQPPPLRSFLISVWLQHSFRGTGTDGHCCRPRLTRRGRLPLVTIILLLLGSYGLRRRREASKHLRIAEET